MSAFLVDARVTVWKPERSAESEFGAYFGGPIPGSTVIDGLRIQFSVEKDDETTANNATITISNLAENTRAEMTRTPLRLILEAGYGGQMSILFSGDVRFAPSMYDGSTWTTEITAKDGGRAIKHARVNKSFRGVVPLATMAVECVQAMGLRAPSSLASHPDLQREYPHGSVVYGLASDHLSKILAPVGMSWSIQNGQVKIVKGNQPSRDAVIVVDEDAGLLGFPTLSPPTSTGERPSLSFETNLFPELEPRRKILLRSKTINGHFRLTSVTHEGDNKTDGAKTSCEGVPI